MTATLNGIQITRGMVDLPLWGIGWAEVELDVGEVLSGQVTLEIAGLTFVCSVIPGRGGVFHEAAAYALRGGFGGWQKTIPETAYRVPLTRLSTVLEDAARATGETLVVDASAERQVGPYVRLRGPASRVLHQLAGRAWWVDPDGKTHVGPRPSAPILVEALNVDRRQGIAHLAVEDVSKLLPGATFEGQVVGRVIHRIDAGSLRSELWLEGGEDRTSRSFRAAVEATQGRRDYFGTYEVRVVTAAADVWDVEPTDATLGLPKLPPVAARPGIPGARVELAAGAHLLISFINGNPARPYVCAFPGTADPGATPAKVVLGAASGAPSGPFLRAGDIVKLADVPGPNGPLATAGIGGIPIKLELHQSQTAIGRGPPGLGYSRVEG